MRHNLRDAHSEVFNRVFYMIEKFPRRLHVLLFWFQIMSENYRRKSVNFQIWRQNWKFIFEDHFYFILNFSRYSETLLDENFVCEKMQLCSAAPKKQKLLGANECTFGPSHWCASHENAKSCGATDFCLEKGLLEPEK